MGIKKHGEKIPRWVKTLLHKPPQAVTKLGTRCKNEYSSPLMHGTDRGGEA